MKDSVILSIAYLPNIQYFSKLLSFSDIIIEVHDTYQKQSFRNRTTILGANGPLDLIIPVKRPQGNKTKTCDVLLDYDMPWLKTHWKTIVSAYRHSPFFSIFEPEIQAIYNNKYKFLVEWNLALIELILRITDITIKYQVSDTYMSQTTEKDFRYSLHPKKRMHLPDPDFMPMEYEQVFSKKFHFIPNLSFIDILFNEGPQAIYLCKKSIKKGQLN